MIPQKLTIKGLYSYQKEQTIDFKQLLDGQLFGIFGSVGSGKSSILEAITFALYGETERLNSRENRNYNMMNLKSDELKIDFEFKNHEDKHYRFWVQGKRHGKDFETVRAFNRKAFVWSEGQWNPIEPSTATEITGLNYRNFKRTIIIPQGKFQEFLQLTDRDRTEMMKEIFHLNKFEFYNETTALERSNNEQKYDLEGQLKNYESVSEQALQEKQEDVSKMQAQYGNEEKKLRAKEDELKKLDKLKEDHADLKEKERAYDQLEAEKQKFDKRENELVTYEKAERVFKHLLEQKNRIQQSLNKRRSEHAEKAQQLGEIEVQLKNQKQKLAETEGQYKNIDHKKDQKADYERWVQVLEANEAIAARSERIENGRKAVEKVKQEKENREKEVSELDTRLEDLKDAMPDQSKLANLKDWHTQKKGILRDQHRIEKEIEDNRKKQAEISRRIENAIPHETISGAAITRFDDSGGVIKSLQEHYRNLEKKSEKLEQKMQHLHLQKKLEEFTHELENGKPCPLCGSIEHPAIMDVEDVQEHLKKSGREKEKLKSEMTACNDALTEVQKIRTENDYYKKNLEKETQALEDTRAKLEAHYKKFSWQEYDPEAENKVDADLEKAARLTREIASLEKQRKEANQNLKKAVSNADHYQNELNKIEQERTEWLSTKNAYLRQLKVMDVSTLPDDKKVAKSMYKKLDEEIADTEKRYDELRKAVQQTEKKQVEIQTALQSIHKAIEDEEKELTGNDRTLSEKIGESDFKDQEEVENILTKDIDTEKQRKEIESYKQDLYAAMKALEAQRKKVKDQPFDPEQHRDVGAELTQLKQKTEELQKALITAKNRVQQLEEDLKKKQELQKQLDKLNRRAENLKTMKQLFKGSGFVNYVSSVFLQDLCQAANERFHKLTRQQMQLEVDERNNFKVRDFLNNGRVRSVKTLSGGQTFQASLSLALALAESVQQQNKANHNFFFLDEGFGTLDQEALRTVFDTLKSLRHENRIVGVISHVEEMQQEIDMYVRITNDPEEGSLLHPSWKNS